MNEMDDKIKEALEKSAKGVAKPPPLQTQEIQAMIAQVNQESARRINKVKWFTFVNHVLALAALLYGAYLLMEGTQANEIALGSFVSTAALAWLIVVKLWFWVIHSRIKLETQLKEMELGIAEIREVLMKRDK